MFCKYYIRICIHVRVMFLFEYNFIYIWVVIYFNIWNDAYITYKRKFYFQYIIFTSSRFLLYSRRIYHQIMIMKNPKYASVVYSTQNENVIQNIYGICV